MVRSSCTGRILGTLALAGSDDKRENRELEAKGGGMTFSRRLDPLHAHARAHTHTRTVQLQLHRALGAL